MTHHEFDKLSDKYLAGNCTPEEIAMLKKWSEEHYHHSDATGVFQQAREEETTGQRIWEHIAQDAFEAPRVRRLAPTTWAWMGVAASLLVLVLFFTAKNRGGEEQRDLIVKGIETKNIGHSKHQVTLPDGSIVVLEENASIITEENYGVHRRSVYLTGEAFFDIKRNPKVPFLVHSGELVTEVLGTSFRIKPQNRDRMIEVSVKSGRVSVYSTGPQRGKKRNGVIITPNQKILYDVQSKTIVQDIVDSPQLVKGHPPASDFRFEEATVQKVISVLKDAFGVEIEVANPALSQCAFTGDLNGLDLYRQLDMVCAVIGAEYEVRGVTVFLNGPGCGNAE
jgi:transmembrane sensor